MSKINKHSHRRLNILTGDWILISPHRTARPWQGKTEIISAGKKQKYNSSCYLCPGNERADGIKNPNYKSTFVFDNDFSALTNSKYLTPLNKKSHDILFNKNLLVSKTETGICRVVCFSSRHDLTLADMKTEEIEKVIEVWQDENANLSKRNDINFVQIFENKGEMMGCSNPHPHGQIWAVNSIPNEIVKETINQKKYFKNYKKCLLCSYLKLEMNLKERILFENENFVWLVPFWAAWPFETMILSKSHLQNLNDFSINDKKYFAEILKTAASSYDKLFNVSFPYSAGAHQSPSDNKKHNEWHFHFHFYPPLLRSASIKKFMVGYEMLAEPQRDISPEEAASALKKILT